MRAHQFARSTVDMDNLVNWRFSRRIGEQVPDAAYACAIEGPRPGRLRFLSTVAFLAALAIGWLIACLGVLCIV
jgi:hypothetical protein